MRGIVLLLLALFRSSFTRLKKVALSLDQLANVIFLWGDEDESISFRLGEAELKGNRPACWFCKFLSVILFDKNHCIGAVYLEFEKALRRVKKIECIVSDDK